MPDCSRFLVLLALAGLAGCIRSESVRETIPESPPSIMLITLDTTRADAMGANTPAFHEVARSGRWFRQAYATVPETLPSHLSMMTGVYPAAHGVHQNARSVPRDQPVLAAQLREAGYSTAAFVSGFPLARQFGLSRGFDFYDDAMEGRAERSAPVTTDRALAYLSKGPRKPVFLWVHYYDPHHPYEPPEPFRSQFKENPYGGEIAAMDQQLGRLVSSFRQFAGDSTAIVIAGDHGESLGEHGEAQHGYLLYQGAMQVPLVVAGPGVSAAEVTKPVSTRRIFHTVRDWAGLGAEGSLRGSDPEIVLGEAMKPYLDFGWRPQVMVVENNTKIIQAGGIEVYNVVEDPEERRDLGEHAVISREARKALLEYPIPSLESVKPPTGLSPEDVRQLASLGYVASNVRPMLREDAPRPRDMAPLFDEIDHASALFAAEQYSAAIPLLESVLRRDPHNLAVALFLGVSHSSLGDSQQAMAAFRKAESIAPESEDVQQSMGLHYVRTGQWDKAAALLENVLARMPDRLAALEGLSIVREKQGRAADVVALLQRIDALRGLREKELIRLGASSMAIGQTPVALEAFERARQLQGAEFQHHLELGVLLMAAGRLQEARDSLDRAIAARRGDPMALFKRAQVSVLLGEPDQAAHIERARNAADETTRPHISRERLFQGK